MPMNIFVMEVWIRQIVTCTCKEAAIHNKHSQKKVTEKAKTTTILFNHLPSNHLTNYWLIWTKKVKMKGHLTLTTGCPLATILFSLFVGSFCRSTLVGYSVGTGYHCGEWHVVLVHFPWEFLICQVNVLCDLWTTVAVSLVHLHSGLYQFRLLHHSRLGMQLKMRTASGFIWGSWPIIRSLAWLPIWLALL